jgi:hypothetical protein
MLCTLEADLSRVMLQPTTIGKGSFHKAEFDIILLFGTTEFKAQLAWTENVSCLIMFNPSEIGLILRVVVRE